jgi:branched-chain amino acid transport system ATP-binding protein
MPPASLTVRNLEAGYGDIQVLWGVDIDVAAGSIVSIVGSNGAGKSTLLLALSGVVKPRAGSITYAGENVTGMSPRLIVERGISHVPEGRRLFKTLSVRDNLLLGAFQRKERSAVLRDLDFVFSVFPILRERASQDATTLSGGEQQMCAIGRGLMARPSLLIIDELSLGLAPNAVELLAESLAKFKAEGISILLVEQDVMTAFEISDYGYVLESGRIAAHGPPAELLQMGKIRDSYLGM